MTHMVIFRTADGKPDYHQADDLAEAMAFVERLRNEESVSDARIFHMEEVPIEFRTYYRVEVISAPVETTPAVATEVASPAPDADLEPVTSGTGRHSLFSRS